MNATENHNLVISIQHPVSFAGFVDVTYLLPFSLLAALWVFLIIILYANRKDIEHVKDNLLIVSIGSVVFIPVYQIPLLSLKIQFLITNYDKLFLGLFIVYFAFIVAVLAVSQTKTSNEKLKTQNGLKEIDMEKKAKKPILTMTRDEGLVIIGVAIGFLVQICYDVSREFTAFVFQGTRTEIYWLITQGVLALIFALLGYVVIKKTPKK